MDNKQLTYVKAVAVSVKQTLLRYKRRIVVHCLLQYLLFFKSFFRVNGISQSAFTGVQLRWPAAPAGAGDGGSVPARRIRPHQTRLLASPPAAAAAAAWSSCRRLPGGIDYAAAGCVRRTGLPAGRRSRGGRRLCRLRTGRPCRILRRRLRRISGTRQSVYPDAGGRICSSAAAEPS